MVLFFISLDEDGNDIPNERNEKAFIEFEELYSRRIKIR